MLGIFLYQDALNNCCTGRLLDSLIYMNKTNPRLMHPFSNEDRKPIIYVLSSSAKSYDHRTIEKCCANDFMVVGLYQKGAETPMLSPHTAW